MKLVIIIHGGTRLGAGSLGLCIRSTTINCILQSCTATAPMNSILAPPHLKDDHSWYSRRCSKSRGHMD
ncbi:hypothetical protein FRX31_017391 [Thalictrum thalictroides]|uniref:Uncharacterized protein n=1 Tax=Thalictrum thalictroides TaxID=46969 RepID=A0A7J6W873_THATH|nr:hypothetical protein FRX31_017391 [Thalictrum thalictroides]